jgi:hypothetical protein
VRKKFPWKPFALGSVLLDLETCFGAGLPVLEVDAEEGIPFSRISEDVIADGEREAEEDDDEDDLALAFARAF